MANFYSAEITNGSDLLEYYTELEPGLHWKIFLGDPKKNIVFRCGESEEELQKAIGIIEGNPDNTNTYMLCVYELEGKKLNYISSCNFQLNSKAAKVSGVNESRIEYLLNKLIEKKESEETEEEKPNWMDNPMIQQLGQLAIGFISTKLFGDSQQIQGTSIAGVNENDPGYLLACLMNKGVTVEHLKKLNAMPDSQLKNLLLML